MSDIGIQLLIVLVLLSCIHVLLSWYGAIHRGSKARRRRLDQLQAKSDTRLVSIIIPAWRERGTIERCVAELKGTSYSQWEAVIVAGGPDETLAMAQEACLNDARFCILEQQPRGKNAALNQGFSAAKGEVIALLDADSEVSSGWLRALVAPLDGTVQATTGNPHPMRRTAISLGEQMEQVSAWEIRGATTLQGSGGIALERKMLENLGGFPEDVSVGVDWDLNARLETLGVARAFCPQAVVRTQRPATLGEYWRNEIRWRRAHFASLLRLSDRFLGGALSAVFSLYIYCLAWFTLALTLLVLATAVVWPAGIGRPAIVLWILFISWLLLRRAALTAEVAAYTQDWRWLKLVWVPPLLLVVTLAACIPATWTWRRQTVHFKGPRPRRSADGGA